jgi:hypothetical protein
MAKKKYMEFILYLTNVGFTLWLENLQYGSHMKFAGMCGIILVILILKKQNIRV